MDTFLALLIFIFVASFTPGPNNIIAMSIGFAHGFEKALPHVWGVTIGFGAMLLIIGVALKPILLKYPLVLTTLKYISFIYLLYIVKKIATSHIDAKAKPKEPISFFESVMFQWVNPKAIAGALSLITIYIPTSNFYKWLFIAIAISSINTILAISMWAQIGVKISHILTDSKYQKIFNYTMAALLLLSASYAIFK